jgi:ubiquinone/menaquinone biosynthesis C-methylase UbiE
MTPHTCPCWVGYLLSNRLRRIVHNPERILEPHIDAGMHVLDVGCAMGFFSLPMARLVGPAGRVTAVDLQERMLEVLRRRAADAGLSDRIETVRCDADTIIVTDEVDFALAFYMAHEVNNAGNLFSQILPALRPGGKLLLVEPTFHVTEPEFHELVGQAQAAGLEFSNGPHIRFSRSALLERPL